MKLLVKAIFEIIFFIERITRFNDIKKFYNYYKIKRELESCGQGVDFQLPIVIKAPHRVRIGNEVSIASFVHMWGGGGIKIGNNVLIGSHSAIVTETHDYLSQDVYHSNIVKPIIIEDNVWIGTHSIIFPGVTIGKGAVIGAGSVVTKSVNAGDIIAGVPGKVIKNIY